MLSKSYIRFIFSICLILTLLPIHSVFSSQPSQVLHLFLSDSLEANEHILLDKLKSSFNTQEFNSTQVINELSDLSHSLNFKYQLINEITNTEFENPDILNILTQFITHIQGYESRFEKSLPPYPYHIYKGNISKIFLFLADNSSEQYYSEYLIESVSYNPDVVNTVKLGDYFLSQLNYKDALSSYLIGLRIDNFYPLLREKAEKCYKELYETTISFDQYVESFNKQQIDIFVDSIQLPKRNDRLKVLNDYGFGKRFYKEKGILLITTNNQDSNYLVNSLSELCKRTNILFQAILINKDDGLDEDKNMDYISLFPEQYQADIWNDFQLSSIPTLIFVGNRQKELLRIDSYNRELPLIVEIILIEDILTEF